MLNGYGTALRRVQGLFGKFVTRHRQCRNIVQPRHTDHFFHQIRFAFNIAAPGWGHSFQATVFFTDFKTERSQNTNDFGPVDFNPGQGFNPFGTQIYRRRTIIFFAANRQLRSLAAANLQNQLGCVIGPRNVGVGIDPAFVTIAGIGLNLKVTAGTGNSAGGKIGAFQQHIHRIRATSFGRAPHNAAQTLHAVIVANTQAFVVQSIFLVFQRHKLFAFAGFANNQTAGQFVGIKNMQRTRQVIIDVVGNINQRRNRVQPDCRQTVFHPFGRFRLVVDTADITAGINRTSDLVFNPDAYRVGKTAGRFLNFQRLEGS